MYAMPRTATLKTIIRRTSRARRLTKTYISVGFMLSALDGGGVTVPITDVFKKQLAQKHRLFYKVCRDCGARNPSSAYRCRKCRGDNLRWKKRELGAK